MPIVTTILPLLMQVGPNPATTGFPEMPERPQPAQPAELAEPVGARAAPSWLEECFELVESDPARAHVIAQVRRDATEGPERVLANHCLGLAATQLERWAEARQAFEAGVSELPLEEAAMRARLGAMAGNAALAGGDTQGALSLLASARSEARRSAAGELEAGAAKDEARALVALGRNDEAEAALRDAVRLTPADGESHLLLATLLRRLGKLSDAQEAIASAAQASPDNAAVGLEAGVIAVLDGRDDAARQSWQSVLDLAPDSGEADSARAYLQQLGPATPAE